MKTYRGDRTIDGIQVTVDGAPLDPRFDLKTLCAEGFEWSYEGAAPAQLALALIADHTGDGAAALRHHDAFMRAVVANFNNEWELTSADMDVALNDIHADDIHAKA